MNTQVHKDPITLLRQHEQAFDMNSSIVENAATQLPIALREAATIRASDGTVEDNDRFRKEATEKRELVDRYSSILRNAKSISESLKTPAVGGLDEGAIRDRVRNANPSWGDTEITEETNRILFEAARRRVPSGVPADLAAGGEPGEFGPSTGGGMMSYAAPETATAAKRFMSTVDQTIERLNAAGVRIPDQPTVAPANIRLKNTP
jgi:hypothetical protein